MRAAAALAASLAALALAACSSPAARPSPPASPTPVGPRTTCAAGDHMLSDATLGWAFCYPQTWRYLERSQRSDHPVGEDVTLDVTDTAADAKSHGQFGFIIIGTYERGSAATLRDWLAANAGDQLDLAPISWGNAIEAAQDRSTGRRYALTPHEVVVLDVRAGQSDFDQELAARLSTWRFTY